jgi:DnaJ-class molecular chaperone
MNRTEALNILNPEGNTPDDIKVAYRAACFKYHPDVSPDSLELMKLVNLAMEFLAKNVGKWTFDQSNNDTPLTEKMQELFNKIKHFPHIETELCGTWLWLSGQTWRYKKELKKAGFKWAGKKRQWYWSPPGFRKRSKKAFSMNDIRNKYGSVELEPELQSAIS